MSSFDIEDGAATITITGWVDRVKAFTPERFWGWMPLVSILCGIAYTFMAKPGRTVVSDRIALGVVLGLTASGLFAGVNSLSKKKDVPAIKT